MYHLFIGPKLINSAGLILTLIYEMIPIGFSMSIVSYKYILQ